MTPASAIRPADDNPPRRSTSDRAIEQAVTPNILQRAASCWGGDAAALAALRAVQNFVYAIELPRGPSILRLTHDSYRSAGEVEAELRWITDLAERGIRVGVPWRSNSGALSEMIDSSHGRFIATCFGRAAGEKPDPTGSERWNERLFENWGALLGAMHNAARARAWTPASPRRNHWHNEIVVRDYERYVPASDALARRAFHRIMNEVTTLPRSPETYGLIHADLHHGNFFVKRDRITAFDFDDSCFHWFAYDLAIPIYHLPKAADRDEGNKNARGVFHSLLRGYRSIAAIDEEWIDRIPLFLRLREIVVYGFYYKALAIESLPEWLRESFYAMRERIAADRPVADISGGELLSR